MNRFTCQGFQPVTTRCARQAAHVFAARQARKDYGAKGYCRTLRLDCWTEDGRCHTFQAFIGRNVDQTTCSGRDIWLHVTREGEAQC